MILRKASIVPKPSQAPKEAEPSSRHFLRRQPPARLVLLGVALLVLGLGAVLASFLLGNAQAKPHGENLPVNAGARDPGDIRANNSPTLVRNPLNPANLVVANRIDTPMFSCALNASFDGGTRWLDTPVEIPKGEEPKCYAPDLAFGADGTLFMSFVTLRGVGNRPHAVWVASSRDGGKTFSKPVKVRGPLAFQVRLTVDPATPGRLYLTFIQASEVAQLRFAQPGNPIQVLRSDDGGASWKRPVQVSNPSRERVLAPSSAVGPKGELYVLYLDVGNDRLDYEGGHDGFGGPPYPGPFQLVLARSLDRGTTWAESVIEDRLIPIERFVAFIPPFPSLAVDRRSGRVYAGYHDGRLRDPDVLVWSLPAGGSAWEGPVRANDTVERDRTSQYLPKLDVAPDGRLDVAYYDRRSDKRNVMNEVSLQSSFDGGASFTDRVRLSDHAFDSRIGFGSEREMPDLGNRLGLVADSSYSVAVWTDTRGGTDASNKQDLARALVTFDPPPFSRPVKYLLLAGGLGLALMGVGVLASGFLGRRG